MTTTVTIEAHCSDDKEVVVGQYNPLTRSSKTEVIQNGEKRVVYSHDTSEVSVFERKKVIGSLYDEEFEKFWKETGWVGHEAKPVAHEAWLNAKKLYSQENAE